ncbi:MAG TPA: hypothetical protein VGA13_05270 [Acidimicrobiales bacterium]|jgi:hypothetical protein
MTPVFRARSTRSAIVSIVAGALLAAAPLAAPTAGADASAFLGFTLLGAGDAIRTQGGDPQSQGFPQYTTSTSHSDTRLGTGPAGRALASTGWPGEFGGNVGSLTQVFGAPEEAGALNYPGRAEAHTPAGPHDDELPGMRAHALGEVTEAFARQEGQGDPAVFDFDEASSLTTSYVDGDLGITRSEALVTDIVFAGGQITIDSVSTVAEARTDGVTGTNAGSTVVSGLTVGGQAATVDEDGIHFGDQTNPSPADAVAQAIGENVLMHFGITMYVTEPRTRDEGGLQEYRSGSLVVDMDLGGEGRGVGTMAFGGSDAYVQASPAITPPTLPPVTVAPTTPPTVPFTSPPPTVAAAVTTPPPTRPTPTTASVEQIAAPPVAAPETELVFYWRGIGIPAWLLVLMGTLLMGRGLVHFHGLAARSALPRRPS